MVVGCSGGSLYAALHRARATTPRTAERHDARALDPGDHEAAQLPFASCAPSCRRSSGSTSSSASSTTGSIARAAATRRSATAAFEDAQIPLYLTATDFHTGEQVVFSQGSIVDAVRASIAIPYVFRPWKIGRPPATSTASCPTRCRSASRSSDGADVIVTMGFESPYQPRATLACCASRSSSRASCRTICSRANYAFHNLAHHTEILPIIPQFREQHPPLRHGQDPVRDRGGRARRRAADPVPPAAPRPPSSADDLAAGGLAGPGRLLVVDDIEMNRDLLSRRLRAARPRGRDRRERARGARDDRARRSSTSCCSTS